MGQQIHYTSNNTGFVELSSGKNLKLEIIPCSTTNMITIYNKETDLSAYGATEAELFEMIDHAYNEYYKTLLTIDS